MKSLQKVLSTGYEEVTELKTKFTFAVSGSYHHGDVMSINCVIVIKVQHVCFNIYLIKTVNRS